MSPKICNAVTAPEPLATTHELRAMELLPQALMTTGPPSALVGAVRQFPLPFYSQLNTHGGFPSAKSSPVVSTVWNSTLWPSAIVNLQYIGTVSERSATCNSGLCGVSEEWKRDGDGKEGSGLAGKYGE